MVVTQDWHTPAHASFASTHAGKKPFETTSMPYGTQVLWPDHCVQGSDDAALHQDLKLPTAGLVIRKDFNKNVDSYSAFIEADGKTMTGLAGYLKERGVDTVFVTGLATDFCVAWTAMDARKLGFTTYVIEDATGNRLVLTDVGMSEEPASLGMIPLLPKAVFANQTLIARLRPDLDPPQPPVHPPSNGTGRGGLQPLI